MYMVQCNKFISFFFEITIKLPFILHLPFLAVEQKKLRSLSQFFTVCWSWKSVFRLFSTQNCSLGYILTMDHWRFCSWVFPIADRSNIAIIKTRNFRFMGCLVSSEILGGRWKQKRAFKKSVLHHLVCYRFSKKWSKEHSSGSEQNAYVKNNTLIPAKNGIQWSKLCVRIHPKMRAINNKTCTFWKQ